MTTLKKGTAMSMTHTVTTMTTQSGTTLLINLAATLTGRYFKKRRSL